MKYILIIIASVFSLTFATAQSEEDPVLWSHEVEETSPGEYLLTFKGKILDGWHVYSQYTAEGGSLPSIFTYEGEGEEYELIGQTEEGPTIREYSEIFEVEETFFKGEALFYQKIELIDPAVRQLKVNLFYQVCKEVCIPKEIDFAISLDGSEAVFEQPKLDEKSLVLGSALKLDLKNKELLNGGNGLDPKNKSGLWAIFGLGFIGGLIALLTPLCISNDTSDSFFLYEAIS